MEAKSYLKRGFNQSRSIELSPKYTSGAEAHEARGAFEIPLRGRIAAGLPVEAIEQRDMLGFADFAGAKGAYALEVRGDSMIDDHICDGDYILLERVPRRTTAISSWLWWRERNYFEAVLQRNRGHGPPATRQLRR